MRRSAPCLFSHSCSLPTSTILLLFCYIYHQYFAAAAKDQPNKKIQYPIIKGTEKQKRKQRKGTLFICIKFNIKITAIAKGIHRITSKAKVKENFIQKIKLIKGHTAVQVDLVAIRFTSSRMNFNFYSNKNLCNFVLVY